MANIENSVDTMTDTALKLYGMNLLSKGLGMVETEKFVSLITSEPFDYTNWRKMQFNELAFDELVNDIRNSVVKGGIK